MNVSSFLCSKCKTVDLQKPGYCAPCSAAYQREWRRSNPEKTRASRLKYRSKPSGEKNISLQAQREASRRYYLKNRERVNARTSLREMRLRSLSYGDCAEKITPEQRQLISTRQKNKCWWCQNELAATFHLDHVIPVSKGGLHALNNLVAACPSCNLKKHTKMPWDFAGRLF